MCSEEKLPDELVKLQIAPTPTPQVKLVNGHLPIALNPFYDDGIKAGDDAEPPLQTSDLIQPSSIAGEIMLQDRNLRPQNCRRCRLRRRSESVLDEFKVKANIVTDGAEATSSTSLSRSIPGVQKQPLKKSPGFGNRKLLLREPVLRALQNCFHSQSNARRKMLAAAADKVDTGTAPPLGAVGRGMTNFRDLINECQTLIEQDVEFSGRLNQLSLNNHCSKNFTTMQSPSKKPITTRTTITPHSTTEESNCDALSPMSRCSMRHRSTPPSAECNAAAAASLASTCAQQAGNGADDVTINELASYFDTLVHIPKKMSSMAEMMYI